MTYTRPLQSSRRSRGFSLIELMISLAIGLIITVAALSAYMGSAGANKISEAQSRMNEDAQAALNLLVQQIRLAGTNPVQANRANAYRHNPVYTSTYVGGSSTSYTTTTPTMSPATYTLSDFSIRGCDGTFTNIGTATRLDALTCTAGGTSTLADSIAVSYEADRYNTTPDSSGRPTDCVGQLIPTEVNATFTTGTSTTATFRVADNRFYVATDAASIPNLYCKGIGGGTQPIVENVEDMQFEYGVVNATSTSTVATIAGYLIADKVVTETSLALLASDALRWSKVLTVRVCVVVRSDTPVLSDASAGAYFNCHNTLTNTTDRRLRRAYSTTVVLRNRRI